MKNKIKQVLMPLIQKILPTFVIQDKFDNKVCSHEWKIDNETINLFIGEKFYYTDCDLWHITGFVIDNDYHATPLVVIKSWVKNKNKWTYQAVPIKTFILNLNWSRQLYRGKDNILKIKITKPKKINIFN